MTVATKISEVRQQVKDWKRNGLPVGLVPTISKPFNKSLCHQILRYVIRPFR